jgi:chaperonin GroES
MNPGSANPISASALLACTLESFGPATRASPATVSCCADSSARTWKPEQRVGSPRGPRNSRIRNLPIEWPRTAIVQRIPARAHAAARGSHLALSARMNIRPLYDRILAARVAEEQKTAGGLYIPDTAKEKPLQAVVIAVGSGKMLDTGKAQPLTVKAGDKILIGKYSGSEVKLEGKDHIILSEDDVLAIIDA